MSRTNIPINQSQALIPDPIQAGQRLAGDGRQPARHRPDAGSGRGGGGQRRRRRRDGGDSGPVRPARADRGRGRVAFFQRFQYERGASLPQLYQESAARKTRDKAINILQGRTVGGSTTVNWTSSFRTPDGTLAYWQRKFGLHTYSTEALAPWFELMEQRLNISEWNVPPNENNDILRRGASKLGIPTALIRRNVNGCWNLGYCGMGCPTNAKQSMLITTIPRRSIMAQPCSRARAERLRCAAIRQCSSTVWRLMRPVWRRRGAS
jgi:choline dehydrogenase-like flavoprotein